MEHKPAVWPWMVTVRTGDESYELVEMVAYCLDDLVMKVQQLFGMNGIFRVPLPRGEWELTLEEWADMLARDYLNGRPDVRQDGPTTITIRGGVVIAHRDI